MTKDLAGQRGWPGLAFGEFDLLIAGLADVARRFVYEIGLAFVESERHRDLPSFDGAIRSILPIAFLHFASNGQRTTTHPFIKFPECLFPFLGKPSFSRALNQR